MLFITLLNYIHSFNITTFYLINNSLSNNILNTIIPYFTNLGSIVVLSLLCALLYLIGGKKGKKVALMGLMGLALTSMVVLIVKPLVAEPRPFLVLAHVNLLVKETGIYSFPSGHSSLIFTIATILGLNYEFKIFNKNIRLIYPTLIIAGLVGFSRIYLGVHYPLDVLAGAIIGISSGLIIMKISKYIFTNKTIEKVLLTDKELFKKKLIKKSE